MNRPIPRSTHRGPSSAPARPLARALEIVRERWIPVAVTATLVFTAQLVRLMLAVPTYAATATLEFTPLKEVSPGAGRWYFEDSLNAIVQANLVVLRSQRLAKRVATAGLEATDGHEPADAVRPSGPPLQLVVEETNAWRPLDVLVRTLTNAHDPCVIEGRCATPEAARAAESRRYALACAAGDAALSVRREGEDRVIAAAPLAPDGRWTLELDGVAVELRAEAGEPRGRSFRLEIRSLDELTGWIQSGVNPTTIGIANGVVDVEFHAPSPRQAQRGAQAIARALVSAKTEEALAQPRRRLAWLVVQEKRVRASLEVAEARLDDYIRTNGTTLLDVRSRALLDESARLLSARFAAEELLATEVTTLAELEATKDPERVLMLLGASGADAKASALTARLVELEIARGTLRRLGNEPDNPDVRKADAEIAIAREQLDGHVAAIRERGLAVHARAIREIEARIVKHRTGEAEVEEKLKALPDQERSTGRLQRDVAAGTRIYEQLVGWREETELAETSITPGVRVLNDAAEQPFRVHPVLTRSLLLAATLALLAGGLIALLLHSRDKTFRSPEALERAAGLPLFAAIPAFRTVPRSERRGLVGSLPAVEIPESALGEIYRTLRANLRFAGGENPVRALAITSALEQEGKTVTTLNLAAVLARGGARVIVVDADLRRPSTHVHLGRPIAPGLTDVVAGRKSMGQAVRRFEAGGFDVLHAGGTPESPGSLLESAAFAALLAELRGAYEYVLFDTPPVLAAADASAIFSRLDGVLLLARSGRSTPDAVDASRERIERLGGRLIGCIFNAFDARRSLTRYGYGYGYRATYGPKGSRASSAAAGGGAAPAADRDAEA